VLAYVDSSALSKRALDERESDALEAALARLASEEVVLISSSLTWVEVARSIRSRLDAEPPADVVSAVETAVSGVVAFPISEQVVSLASRLGPSTLRTLDALHLASATLLNVDVVLAYDRRMLTAAAELGFRTMSPE
jgi:predicted nucleic acid-binding protein